jgi:hypothetical protein
MSGARRPDGRTAKERAIGSAVVAQATHGAWASRPARREVLSERRITATRSQPLEVTRYDDATVYDRLLYANLITNRQHDAARIAHMLFLAAGLVPRVVGRLDTLDEELAEIFEPRQEREARDPAAPSPRDKYRAIMRRLGGFHAGLVEGVLLGQSPTRAWVASLAAGLDKLGDILGLR